MSPDYVPEKANRRALPPFDPDERVPVLTGLPFGRRVKDFPWHPIITYLETAVPLIMLDLSGRLLVDVLRIGKGRVDTIASRADVAMYGDRKRPKGETASAAHEIAVGIACLAFNPGGVTVMGVHWCAVPPCLFCPTERPQP